MDLEDDFIPPIRVTAAGDTPNEQTANLKRVRPSPGYPVAMQLLAEIAAKDADLTVLDYSPNKVTMRYRIDGLWHGGPTADRETGDYLLAVLKQLAGMDYKERRKPQEGSLTSEYQKQKQKFRIVSRGIKTGERVAVYLSYKKPPMETLTQLGMRSSMLATLAPHLNSEEIGTTFVSAIPGEGYTSAWRGVLDGCDLLTRDYYVIEDAEKVEPEVINISSLTFDRSKGETPMTPMPALLLREPNVLGLPNIENADELNAFSKMARDHELPLFLRGPGKHCVDSVLRVAAMKPDMNLFAETLRVIVCMRMIRKLCEHCRIEYKPRPELLEKLGLPVGRVGVLYRPFVWKPGMVDEEEEEIEACEHCSGIGYRGRTGLFEMLEPNDEFRQTLATKPSMRTLQQIAQANGHLSLMKEGAILIAKGTTSVDELQRVLKV